MAALNEDTFIRSPESFETPKRTSGQQIFENQIPGTSGLIANQIPD